jgi:hypothetical protein
MGRPREYPGKEVDSTFHIGNFVVSKSVWEFFNI